MSGGSFDYLCNKDSETILNHIDDLNTMLITLKSYRLKNTEKVERTFEILIEKINISNST